MVPNTQCSATVDCGDVTKHGFIWGQVHAAVTQTDLGHFATFGYNFSQQFQ